MNLITSSEPLIKQGELDDQQLPLAEAVDRIEKLKKALCDFWSSAQEWAPDAAAELMSKSRLDRQVSLSRSLRRWIVDPPDALEDGDLILG